MKPVTPSSHVSVFMLAKQTGATLCPVGFQAGLNWGTGMFTTLLAAEHQRLVEMLSDTTNSKYHIFELEIPNPAYEQGKSS